MSDIKKPARGGLSFHPRIERCKRLSNDHDRECYDTPIPYFVRDAMRKGKKPVLAFMRANIGAPESRGSGAAEDVRIRRCCTAPALGEPPRDAYDA
jgi:hypothetical protein